MSGARVRGALQLDLRSAHCQFLSTLGIRWGKALATDLATGQSGHGGHTGIGGGPWTPPGGDQDAAGRSGCSEGSARGQQ